MGVTVVIVESHLGRVKKYALTIYTVQLIVLMETICKKSRKKIQMKVAAGY